MFFFPVSDLDEHVLCDGCMQYFLFGRLLEFSRNDRFIKEVVRLVEIEDDVQLAHVPKVTIQNLNVVVDHLENKQ